MRAGLAAEKSSQTLRRRLAYERFETQPNSFRIGCRAASLLRLLKQLAIDIECLLHTYDYAIYIWLLEPAYVADTDVPQADNSQTVLAAIAVDNIGLLRA